MSIDRVRPGSGVPARSLRRLAEGAEGLSRLSVAPPLSLSLQGGSPLISLVEPATFWGTLSGTTSPYSVAEAVGTAGGAWAALSGGRAGTSNAYEANAVAGLGGKVVLLSEGVPGDYRFLYARAGVVGTPAPTSCGCGPTPTTFHAVATYVRGIAGNAGNAYENYYVSRFLPTDWAAAGSGVDFTWGPIPTYPGFPASVASSPLVAASGYIHQSNLQVGNYRFVIYPVSGTGAGGVTVCNWNLLRYYPPGSTLPQELLYAWNEGGTLGNTCTPWNFASGQANSLFSGASPGSGQSITVTMT
jgi:hypothetical protein